MSDLEHMHTSGVTCNGAGCGERIQGPQLSILDKAYWLKAIEQGWSIWIGRSRRHYCPKHWPKPGHKMTRWEPAKGDR